MIIRELYIAEFGGIKNKKIEFGKDKELNIIYGENESGKSTVFLFIKFMLYGLQRKSQSNTERERSLSWSGGVASGSLTFEQGGKEYRIERTVSDRARSEKLTVLSLFDGHPVITDKSVGEYFLGVPREVFESSACIGQMRSSEINGEKTAQSLSNMLSSADEGVDTASVLKELNNIRVSYLHKNQMGGSLFESESKIKALRMKLDDAKNASLAIEGKSESFDKIKREYDDLKLELEKKDALVTQFNKIGIIRRFEALRQKESELDLVVGKKDICAKQALNTEFFPDRTHVAELRAASRELFAREQSFAVKEKARSEQTKGFDCELAALGERAEQSGGREALLLPFAEKRRKARSKAKLGAILGVVAIAAAAFCAVSFFAIDIIVGVIALILSVAIAAGAIAVAVLSQKEKKRAVSELVALADSYKATPDSLGDRIDECLRELALMRAYNVEHARLNAEAELAEESLEESRARAYKLLALTLGENAEPECQGLDAEADRLCAFLDEYDILAREEDAFLRMLENEKNALARYDEQRLRDEITVDINDATPEAVEEAERTKSFLMAKKSACESRIVLLQNELIALRIKAEDPMPIADRLAQLEEKTKRDREFYEALVLAMSTIEDSSASMRGSITPVISKSASELMSRISDSKYDVLRTNTKLGVFLDKDGFGISSELLSAGTRDAAYLALRIALIMQIYAQERPPIILDESLCQLDDTRLQRTVELLCSLAKEGMQIIIFTSHKREETACEMLDCEYSLITL